MRGPAVRPVVIAAGGTGGHFFPAEALAGELMTRGHRVVLMTDARSGGLRSPVFADAERFVLRGAGLAGHGTLHRIGAAAALAAGTLQARRILSRLDAAAVVGFGGYPSVAPVLAARLLRARRPAVVLHEQNAVLGRANRWLLRRADRLALSFAGTTRVAAGTSATVTGNPVRAAIRALAGAPVPVGDGTFRLLVLGGSLGARAFSDVVPAALASLPDAARARLHVTQQCRPEDLERVRDAYARAAIACELAAFFPDVAGLLARADCVIARAGASTVAELAVAARPCLLVPLPHAIDDHQAANARAVGAVVMAQPAFTAPALAARVAEWLEHPEALGRVARQLALHARPDAASRLADLVEHVVAARARGREHVA